MNAELLDPIIGACAAGQSTDVGQPFSQTLSSWNSKRVDLIGSGNIAGRHRAWSATGSSDFWSVALGGPPLLLQGRREAA